MSKIAYGVPLVAQARSMSCWYAAACMVAYTYEAGPRYGIPQAWLDNSGITVEQVQELARTENMKVLVSSTHEFTAASLIATLSAYGPIWSAGMWFGVAHAIVITGADDEGTGKFLFNDPDGAVAKTNTIAWLNEKRIRGTMLARGYPPPR